MAAQSKTHQLSLWDATMLVAGSMIGSGIFIVGADMFRQVGSSGWYIMAWGITGIMTITAALSYGELSGMFPKAGGQYVYLKEAYSPMIGFLYGWSFFSVIQTGTIAAVGVAFAKFAAYIFPNFSEDNKIFQWQYGMDDCHQPLYFSISMAQIVALCVIIFLTYLHTKGLKGGKIVQNIFTSTKLLALFGLILFGFFVFNAGVWENNWTNAWRATQQILKDECNPAAGFITNGISGTLLMSGIAVAMVGSVFSSDAWNNVTFIAGEIKNPKKNIGLSLFLGTFIVTLIYIATNLMYLAILPIDAIAHAEKDRVAILAASSIGGYIGTIIVAALIMIATFGCNNGLILAGARVYYTMAQDGLFFNKAAYLNKNQVPAFALWAQCVVACLLCLSGKYGDLLDMIAFIVVLFYVLTIIGIFILRKKQPNLERPYKAFGYPIVPIIYVFLAILFCSLLLINKPHYTFFGLAITLLGIPLFYVAMKNKKTI